MKLQNIRKGSKRENIYIIYFIDAVAQSVTVKPTGCGFDLHSRRWNIYLNLYFHFFALVSRTSAALNSATQHAMPPESAEKGERSVLALGSLCVPCSVRDTAWSWFFFIYFICKKHNDKNVSIKKIYLRSLIMEVIVFQLIKRTVVAR